MSRFLTSRRRLTFAEALERPDLLEAALEADHDRQLARFEREEDRLEAEGDRRSRGSWTYIEDNAA